MRVSIKNFNVNVDVKSNGIEFEVRSTDDQTQLGDCFLTMTGLTWCNGKTTKANGTKIPWQDFIAIMTSEQTKSAAVKAAKQIVKEA